VQAIKRKRPDILLMILIDADEGGKGTHAASLVANEFPDATFRKPSFEHLNETGTDFNDVLQIGGWDEVRQQLERSFEMENSKIEEELKNNASHSKTQSSDSKASDKAKTTQFKGRCETAGDVLKEIGLLEKIKNRMFNHRQNPNEIKLFGHPTNFKQLDEIIDGLQGGHLIVFAGRTGMGKTFAALNILKNMAIEQRIPSALYSLEMSNSEIFYRLISLLSGIPSKKIKRGIINDDELHQVEEAMSKIESSPLFVTDDPANSVLKNLHSNMKRGLCEGEAKIIFVDHIGLVNCGSGYKDNRATELGAISMAFKLLAKEHDTPIISLAQLNREADSKDPPKLSQLRDSGELEQNADIVLFIHRRDYYDKNDKPGQADIIVAKNRHGETGAVTFKYNGLSWLLEEFPPLKEMKQKQYDENGREVICKLN
jgi:replicative DNA helicase